jgi:cytochrome c5
MKTILPLIFGALSLACCLIVAAQQQNPPAKKVVNSNAAASAAARREGEMRFRENCGRCHNPPESLSPREVKAVLQHMRVRAMLSAEDEQLILKYLAP